MGGGTKLLTVPCQASRGLSPRGRGNLEEALIERPNSRSIPAWAGEPPGSLWRLADLTVYPRVGGGTFDERDAAQFESGLSPRGRGNLSILWCSPRKSRSIPAWAGEPLPFQRKRRSLAVYPRVGGGTWGPSLRIRRSMGLSPAWAGEPLIRLGQNGATPVYPTRGRGNLAGLPKATMKSGSIPAWAGEPAISTDSLTVDKVYPRVGGGTSRIRSIS